MSTAIDEIVESSTLFLFLSIHMNNKIGFLIFASSMNMSQLQMTQL